MDVLVIADPHIPVPPVDYGGTERIVALLCDELRGAGHRVHLMAAAGSARYGGRLHVHRAPTLAYPSRAYRKLRFQLDLLRMMRGVDLVVSFGRSDYLVAALHTRTPLICWFQNPMSQREIDAILARRRERVRLVGISRSQVAGIEPRELVRVVPNAVPVAAYTFAPRPADPPYLAFVGRLTRNKGVDLAIEVAARAGLPLKIAGNVSNEEGDAAFFEREIRPRLGAGCEWVGPVDDRRKDALLGGAVASLFPIRWDEPFGIVMAESLACGTPVIANHRASTPEVVRDGETGFLCRSADEMVEAVRRAPGLDRRACRADAEARFGPDSLLAGCLGVAAEVLGEA